MHDYRYCRKLIALMWFFLLAGIQTTASAAEVSAEAMVDRAVVTVGDVITLTIEVRYDDDIAPRMPGANTTLGDFEVRDHWSEAPQAGPGGQIVAKSHFSLTVFSPGVVQIPAVEITYVSSDGTRQGPVETEPVEVKVARVLADKSEDIQDIKAPLEIPRDWLPILIAFLGGAILAAFALYFFWVRNRKAALSDTGPMVPDRPPHEFAYESLDRIKRSDLLVKGEIPRFHILIAEIIRRYIEGRYRVDALEMASWEVLDGLRHSGVEKDTIPLFERFLDRCDMVKFAKSRPSANQSLETLNLAFEIIDLTRPLPVSPTLTEQESTDGTTSPSSEPGDGTKDQRGS